jgi:hypothetical protein
LTARAIPDMNPVAGILVRGVTVVVVMGSGLWLGGFLRPEELRVLERIGRPRATAAATVASPADTTEFAGEIVTTDFPDQEPAREPAQGLETVRAPESQERTR